MKYCEVAALNHMRSHDVIPAECFSCLPVKKNEIAEEWSCHILERFAAHIINYLHSPWTQVTECINSEGKGG